MKTQTQLVDYLKSSRALRSAEIIRAFNNIDRKDFVLPAYEDAAYEDVPLAIGYGQSISQPFTVAFMLELLQPKLGQKILDVGSGSGWTTALLAAIVGLGGRVFGVERHPMLIKFGLENIAKYKLPHATISPASNELGLPGQAPFDRILVSAAAKKLPRELVGQLVVGGCMVIPIKNSVWQVIKLSKTKIIQKEFPGFAFVPLKA